MLWTIGDFGALVAVEQILLTAKAKSGLVFGRQWKQFTGPLLCRMNLLSCSIQLLLSFWCILCRYQYGFSSLPHIMAVEQLFGVCILTRHEVSKGLLVAHSTSTAATHARLISENGGVVSHLLANSLTTHWAVSPSDITKTSSTWTKTNPKTCWSVSSAGPIFLTFLAHPKVLLRDRLVEPHGSSLRLWLGWPSSHHPGTLSLEI